MFFLAKSGNKSYFAGVFFNGKPLLGYFFLFFVSCIFLMYRKYATCRSMFLLFYYEKKKQIGTDISFWRIELIENG